MNGTGLSMWSQCRVAVYDLNNQKKGHLLPLPEEIRTIQLVVQKIYNLGNMIKYPG